MPYANEHAARLADPDRYARFARQNGKFGPGVDAVWGITREGKTELQAIRFDASKFTPKEARKWLREHDHRPILFEPARDEAKELDAMNRLLLGAPLNGHMPLLLELKAKARPAGADKIGTGHVKPLSKTEQAFRAVMADIFTRQIEAAAKAVPKFAERGEGTLLDRNVWTKETDQLTLPLRWHPFKAGGDTALDAISFDLPEWVESKHVLDALRQENFEFARKISTSTADRLREELLEGMANGEMISQLKQRVFGVRGEWAKAGRDEMIARTESARAHSSGSVEAWKETDVVAGKEWLAAGDACEFCFDMSGRKVALDENFEELGTTIVGAKGGEMSIGYTAISGPPLHPNCRCTLLGTLEEKP